MKKKGIIPIVIVILLVAYFFAQRAYNKPYLNVEKASSDIVISSVSLLNNYSTDEEKSNAAYLEKVIEVSGIITEIRKEKNATVVTLDGGSSDGTVMCYLLEEDNKKMLPTIGDSAVIKGVCTGYLLDVILVRCVLIK